MQMSRNIRSEPFGRQGAVVTRLCKGPLGTNSHSLKKRLGIFPTNHKHIRPFNSVHGSGCTLASGLDGAFGWPFFSPGLLQASKTFTSELHFADGHCSHGFQPGGVGSRGERGLGHVSFLGLTLGQQSQMDSPAHGPGDGLFGATWKSAR